jgi:enediyne biosynthesis protein E4
MHISKTGRLEQRPLLVTLIWILASVAPTYPHKPPEPFQREIRFVDVTKPAGITFKHANASSGEKYLVETMGGGCAFFDYDNDGYLDIYLVNGAPLPGFKSNSPITGALYRNNRDETFTDVTAKAGVGTEGTYGMGVAVADFDNDGNQDLYITGFGRSVLYRNCGDGTFADVTLASHVANNGHWATSAAFFDFDNDGFLDLYVANYLDYNLRNNKFCGDVIKGVRSYCHPDQYDGVPDVLYHNNRDGTFADVSEKAGISNSEGKGLGVVAADLDGEGYLDLYVANDSVANFLYLNNGDGTFKNIAPFSGTAYSADGQAQAGMGVDVGDYNHDGKPDILVTNFSLEGAALYRGDRKQLFTEISSQVGLREPSFLLTGWGTKFFDYDNDGDEDIFIANGHPQDDISNYTDSLTYEQPKLLLENDGGVFRDVSKLRGEDISKPSPGRGVAFGDFDNDGDMDLLIANSNQPPALLRNEGGNRNNWVKLKLIGTKSNRDAIGAKVKVSAGGIVQTDHLRGGGSYLSAHDPRLHFGVGKSPRIDSIEIIWPSGRTQSIKDIKANQILEIQEP